MKTVSAALAAHIAGPVTTLATCWRITRTDGLVFRFTDHDRDLAADGEVYAQIFRVTSEASADGRSRRHTVEGAALLRLGRAVQPGLRLQGGAGRGLDRCRQGAHLGAIAHERGCEADLAALIDAVLDAGGLPDLADLRARVTPDPEALPQVTVTLTPLSAYDALTATAGATA